MMAESNDLDRLGGEEGLRRIVADFIGRVTNDLMIGFHFREVDRDKLIRLEFEFARAHLGGPQEYSGRPLRAAHARHRIMGGQFNRRLRILQQTLDDHEVPDDIQSAWLDHNERLRSHITSDSKTECND